MCPDTPSCRTNMCNKAIDLLRGDLQGSGGDLASPENEALSCTAQQRSGNQPEVWGARRWDFQLFSLRNSWVVSTLPCPSAFQSGGTFILSPATSHNQLHAFQVRKPRPIGGKQMLQRAEIAAGSEPEPASGSPTSVHVGSLSKLSHWHGHTAPHHGSPFGGCQHSSRGG